MDTVFLIGSAEEALVSMLKRLGHKILSEDGGVDSNILSIIENNPIDLILINSSEDKSGHHFCELLRLHDASRETPILVMCPDKLQELEVKNLELPKVDTVSKEISLAQIATKIITTTRLGKMKGLTDLSASLTEANSALRDLTDKFKKELKEAQEIQKALLPKSLPVADFFDLAVEYTPLEQVGGDWYFCEKTKDDALTFFVGDVTGHGLPAALIGSMTKLALSAAETNEPSELLTKVNRLMSPHLPEGRFVTANAFFIGRDGVLHSARAGGPKTMIFRSADSSVFEVEESGMPLGFFEDTEFTPHQEQLEIGDIVVLATDGIFEAQSRDRVMFGVEGWKSALKQIDATQSAGEILKNLRRSFDAFIDGRILKDDITIAVLKRTK